MREQHTIRGHSNHRLSDAYVNHDPSRRNSLGLRHADSPAIIGGGKRENEKKKDGDAPSLR